MGQRKKKHMNPVTFEGTLQKIQLISNNVCYGPCPEPEDEIEQHLTITADGRVWLSRYRFSFLEGAYELIEKQHFNISAESADKIMAAVAGYFENANNVELATDVGSWDLVLTNTEGRTYKMTGSLYYDLQTASGGLSDLIRSCLNRNDLLVFDGNSDTVVRIEIKYHRSTKIKPKVIPEEYVIWDYNEFLTIDRAFETLEYIREIGSGCKVTNTYYVQDGITSFLDNIDIDVFSEIAGDPPDVVEDPLETKEYTITLYTKHGEVRIITGTFDKNGLPADWAEFIDSVYEFIAFYGISELFDKKVYGKAKRRQSDFIFCNVLFEEGGRTYCYLADSDAYCEGDLVVVPAGRDNHEAIVRIESIEYHSVEEAPYPIEKTKHILRGYKEDE